MDLRSGYREFRPPAALRGVVACLWVRVPEAAAEVRVVPDGCSDVIWRRGEGTIVAGPETAPTLVHCSPGDLLVGMRLQPGAGGGALGIPLDELRDLHVDVTEVEPRFDADPELAPAEVAVRFVSAVAGRRADPLVARAAPRVLDQPVDAIARELGISERQLRRRFHAAAGYGPGTLARVLRFRRFVVAIDRGRSDLGALAFDVGYADQAHLTREATRLAGLPPAALLRARRRSS